MNKRGHYINLLFPAATCRMIFCSCLVLFPFASSPRAQEANGSKAGVAFELGAIGTLSPSYEGSDRFVAYPLPVFRFHYLRLENGFQLGGGDDEGFSIYPSLAYRGKRTSDKDSVLAGLPDVDEALELGAGVSYQRSGVKAFVDLRYGVSGHNGFVGETGIDLIAETTDKLTVSFGPRLSFATKNYMDAYFGVSSAAVASSGLTPHSTSGGFKSAGLEANVRYDLTENWVVEGVASWNRLIGDAGSSPIVALGDKNQYVFGIGFTRKFEIGF